MHHLILPPFWPGYTVIAQCVFVPTITLFTLEPRADLLPRCRRCLQPTPLDPTTNVSAGCVSETHLTDKSGYKPPVRRVDCLRCGRVSEHIDWLPSGSRLTRRMQCWIGVCSVPPHPPCQPALTGVGWHTIKEIDKHRLQTSVGTIELGDAWWLVMDEFAYNKGTPLYHRDHGCRANPRPVGGARQQPAAIRPFFEQLGELMPK